MTEIPLLAHVSLRCKLYADRPHRPCSGTIDDGTERPCQCKCHHAWIVRYLHGKFSQWYLAEHGDSEGPWCREEMEAAWLAGYQKRIEDEA